VLADSGVPRHHRRLPRLVKGPFRYKTYAADYFNKSKRFAKKPMKAAVIAPSMMYLLYPLEGEVESYARERFVGDLISECEKDIRQCFAAGAVRVSIDFTEGASVAHHSLSPFIRRCLLTDTRPTLLQERSPQPVDGKEDAPEVC